MARTLFRPLLFVWLALAVADWVSPLTAQADDWPQFLGPHRNGISDETGLIEAWPDGGPPEVWRVKGGTGMSGLAISGGWLVTMVERDGEQLLVALDPKSGESLWETAVAPAYRNSMGGGPRATPTIAGETVFAYSGEGVLVAAAVENGDIAWRHDVLGDLGGEVAPYGMASSPLAAGKLVIVTAGAPGAAVVAFDQASGKLAWKAGDETAGYSSPALLTLGSRKQVVVFAGKSAMGLTPETGQELWRYPYETNFDCNIATPLAHEGNVFISCGENHGSALLSLAPQGKKFQVREVWTSNGPQSVLRNEWQTSILLDGHLYGLDNVGGAGPVTHLNCVEIATGKRVWQEQRFGKANLIAADGKLFFSTLEGELVLVKPTPDGYEELGRAQVTGPTRQAPALADGLLYLRDDKEIVCLDVRKQ